MAEVQKQELAMRIRLAFKNVKYPGRKIGDKEELRDLLGKKREDLTPQDINKNRAYIFFTYEGLKYYLPTYLIALLENTEQISRDVGVDFIKHILYESGV